MKSLAWVIFAVATVLSVRTTLACTMFTATQGETVLVGNNEDAKFPHTKVWFVPPSQDRYGGIYFGWDERWPQGGMNDQGLVFDIFATPHLEIKTAKGKPQPEKFITRKIMSESATVEEALQVLRRYYQPGLEYGQLMYVDASGEAAIFEGDVVHRKSGPTQIATNFYLSQVTKDEEITCRRYRTTSEMLSVLEPTVESFRQILHAVHFEGNWGGTQYSNIYLPKERKILLYHFHDFENVVVLDMETELANGERTLEIASLFPENFAYETYLEAIPETPIDVLRRTYETEGLDAVLSRAQQMTEGWKELQPIFDRYFAFEPAVVAGSERAWSPALVAGDHWKTRQVQSGPDDLKELGIHLRDWGKATDATAVLEANRDSYPDFLPNYYWLAVIYRESGQLEMARTSIEKGLLLSPDNDALKAELEKIVDAESLEN
jgi:tetratricopeptide (TPR) repeat protein